jgi:hypothetical protein
MRWEKLFQGITMGIKYCTQLTPEKKAIFLTIFEGYRLKIWEECAGKCEEIQEVDGYCLARIGRVRVALSCEMLVRLRPLLGQTVSILRTDLSYEVLVIEASAMDAPKSTRIPKTDIECVLSV